MSTPSTEGTSADHSRSGEDIAEAIEVAERGSAVEEVHDQGTGATSGEAPVERSAGDPEMTEGQVVHGSDRGGSGAAMVRLNTVRDELKGLATTRRFV